MKDWYMAGMLKSLGSEKGKGCPTEKDTLDKLKEGAQLGRITAKQITTKMVQLISTLTRRHGSLRRSHQLGHSSNGKH
jgi:hypothetical protein